MNSTWNARTAVEKKDDAHNAGRDSFDSQVLDMLRKQAHRRVRF